MLDRKIIKQIKEMEEDSELSMNLYEGDGINDILYISIDIITKGEEYETIYETDEYENNQENWKMLRKLQKSLKKEIKTKTRVDAEIDEITV